MRISGTPAVLAPWLLALTVASNAMATTTGATASAFVSGHTLSQSDTQDKQGAQAGIERLVPGGATIRAQASSTPGTLQAAGFAASDGLAGGFQGNATASWSDSFVISAPSHEAFQTGTFSGSASVSGRLLTKILGRAYSDAQIDATVDPASVKVVDASSFKLLMPLGAPCLVG
jgi:hypothetical protein